MSEASQIEFIKQLPLIITAIGTMVVGLFGVVLQILNRREILEVKHATNSLLDRRVDAAKAEGRIDERNDQRERNDIK